ncbi:transcription-repair coupling factor [Ferrimicrobium acidiphilum]|jgi:transcription-repair coupling factor (superfamily II helicase)|uniref:transcription-repair coupling factor n=1 Tax=Ferrimicrobium acidiphilum TaxID=121039 RepID=UPI0023F542B3|nr:transcription-repair coupling factor [Ferrimicrobium acidiphilum]MCL5054013.1 transcription-repair coupling factor [Gammaproteobacteria bacterium]
MSFKVLTRLVAGVSQTLELRTLGVAPAVSAALVAQSTAGRRILVIVASEVEAETIAYDIASLQDGCNSYWLPAWDTVPFERVAPSMRTVGLRLRALSALQEKSESGVVVTASVRSALQRLAPSALDLERFSLHVGSSLPQVELVEFLLRNGYLREAQVSSPGEFAVRGSIVDLFPPDADSPIRADFFGDELDRLGIFDPGSQVTIDAIGEYEILPAREVLVDGRLRAGLEELAERAPVLGDRIRELLDGTSADPAESLLPLVLNHQATIPSDLLDEDDVVILAGGALLEAESIRLVADELSMTQALAPTWGIEATESTAGLLASFDHISESPAQSVLLTDDGADPHPLRIDHRDMTGFVERVGSFIRRGFRVIVTAESQARVRALTATFASFERYPIAIGADADPPETAGLYLLEGVRLYHSFIVETAKLVVVADAELVRPIANPRTPRRSPRTLSSTLDDLAPGTLVVHETYGIARYQGIVSRSLAEVERDYLLLEFGGKDKIYLPSDQTDRITLYVGGEDPALSRLGSREWSQQVRKARRAANEVAQELVVLYQKRLVTVGHAKEADTPWQDEMESAFPYELTPDQVIAIEEMKRDLEQPIPMDRMICGDVGFGKTEIAIRAAFKTIQSGNQVAILVPTTILAQQHYDTFRERFEPYGVKVGLLSRFVSGREVKRLKEELRLGTLDCLVATHALVSKEIDFKRLGLLVIDEEQRFGVQHKEFWKTRHPDLDVLTLSATPIPRTLELSLVGVRDMSLLRTPPLDRQPILTHVGPDDDAAISEAIRRELIRGGQVFYVHNRVRDIQSVARKVADLVPTARILIAHGQLPEHELERVVDDFWHRRADVLVCTTIIESGIDLPSVNTLIVDHAEDLGLGQLHQLRGRVGRSGQRAYAYLFYPRTKPLSVIALERLRTIVENTDLGSGYRIAMRDLELRGAGTFLGQRQSGHMSAVGYELYVRLVAEAVAQMKGDERIEVAEINIDLPISYSIPVSYVEEETVRMDLYRRLALARTDAEVTELAEELIDRFGPHPDVVANLIAMTRLKLTLIERGVHEVGSRRSARTGGMEVFLRPLELRPSEEVRLRRLPSRPSYRAIDHEVVVPFRPRDDLLALVGEIVMGSPNSRS